MNKVLKIGAAGALTFAGVAAHASIPSPSLSSSDAVLFGEVLASDGTTVVASYAGDTGLTIAQLDSGSYTGTVLGSDSNLGKLFTADNATAGNQLVWAVQGAQNTTGSSVQFVTTTAFPAKLGTVKNLTLTNNWAPGFQTDVATVNSNSLGAASVEGAVPASSGVWDVNNTGGTEYWYGSLPTSQTLGTAASLYSEVTNGTAAATKGISALIGTVTLSSAGLLVTGSSVTPPPVPLPAAVWLLGSGLLGLAGVARRKSKA